MRKETKKYLRKRRQVIDIITSVNIQVQDPYDETCLSYIITNVDFWEARKMAEEILEKVGINKTKEVKDQESYGYAIG